MFNAGIVPSADENAFGKNEPDLIKESKFGVFDVLFSSNISSFLNPSIRKNITFGRFLELIIHNF